jgi:hypothetical protein
VRANAGAGRAVAEPGAIEAVPVEGMVNDNFSEINDSIRVDGALV